MPVNVDWTQIRLVIGDRNRRHTRIDKARVPFGDIRARLLACLPDGVLEALDVVQAWLRQCLFVFARVTPSQPLLRIWDDLEADFPGRHSAAAFLLVNIPHRTTGKPCRPRSHGCGQPQQEEHRKWHLWR